MDNEHFEFKHNGRTSVARGTATDKQVKAFRNALQLQEFYLSRETDELETFTRNIRMMSGDWAMRVLLKRQGSELEVTSYLFIPWTWIVSFGVFAIIIIPFLSYRGTPLAFPLAVAVIAFAIYKQRFDLRVDAGWQGAARTKWNGILHRLLRECFAGRNNPGQAARLAQGTGK